MATSDNPVLWFTFDVSNTLHLMMMPVNPQFYAVAWDSRFCQVTGEVLSSRDEGLLNREQARHCHTCLYTAAELSLEEQEFVRQIWRTTERPSGYVDEKKWDFPVLELPAGQSFSFLKIL